MLRRRKISLRTAIGIIIIVSAILVAFMDSSSSSECEHEWVYGAFFVKTCSKYMPDCPVMNPPIDTVVLEHCRICGAVRIPAGIRGRRSRCQDQN